MADEEVNGTILRGADGSMYFLRDEVLEATKITEPEMQAFCSELIAANESEVAGFAMETAQVASFRGPFMQAKAPITNIQARESTVMCAGVMKSGSFQVNPAPMYRTMG